MIAIVLILVIGCLVALVIALAENALPTDKGDQR